MKAYGNHWRIVDEQSRTYLNYDSGVVVVKADGNAGGPGNEYVGQLEHIIELNYGSLHTPIVLFMCEWKKRCDNMGRDTYQRDRDGFLSVNFKYNLPKALDPFVFPEQVTQVFYCNDNLRKLRKGEWKVVLRKDACSRREGHNDDNFFIYTDNEAPGLAMPECFTGTTVVPNLAGAILLNDRENDLAVANFDDLHKVRQCKKRKKRTTEKLVGKQRVPLMRRQ